MADRIMGIEREYHLSAMGPGGRPHDPARVAERVMTLARKNLVHLPGHGSAGIFTPIARIYPDSGRLELATAETNSPHDLVRYSIAGDRTLVGLVDELGQARDILDPVLSKVSVTYARRRTTAACHESYGHRIPRFVEVSQQMIPFLASRLVISGPGGFEPLQSGLSFRLDPRVSFITRATGGTSTHTRPIYHEKDESLARNMRRMHVLCGGANCSHTSDALKVGATALVISMIEAGLRPGEAVVLRQPVSAMKSFSADVDLLAKADTVARGFLTAIEIQRHYQQMAQANAAKSFMPSWAPEYAQRWGDALHRLEQGRSHVELTLDWAIKYRIYNDYMRRRGFDWDLVERMNIVAERLGQALRFKTESPQEALSLRHLASGSPIRNEILAAEPVAQGLGFDMDRFADFLQLCAELFELDMRYAQLNGEQGVFASLDRQGALEHRIDKVDRIEEAMTEPPDFGRPRIRGKYIQRHGKPGGSRQASAEWDMIYEHRGRTLDLGDPLAETENWTAIPPRPAFGNRPSRSLSHPHELLDQVYRFYGQGNYRHAMDILNMSPLSALHLMDTSMRHKTLRYRAWVRARLGYLDWIDSLDMLRAERPGVTPTLANDYVCCQRFTHLVPDAGKMERYFQMYHDARQAAGVRPTLGFDEHRCYCLMKAGRLDEAEELAARVDDEDEPRIRARVFATLGELRRIKGERFAARSLLHKARTLQTSHDHHGELAEMTRTTLAKMQRLRRRALSMLAEIKSEQTTTGNQVGFCRSLLLEARITCERLVSDANREMIIGIRNSTPALSSCRWLSRTLSTWEAWVGGERPDNEIDDFWGL